MGELMLIAGALAWTVLLAWRVNVALNQMRAVMRRVADRKHEVHYYEPVIIVEARGLKPLEFEGIEREDYEPVIIVEVEGPLDEDDDIVLDFGGDPFWN